MFEGGLTTSDFDKLGLSFEQFLRYCQLAEGQRKKFDEEARKRLAKMVADHAIREDIE